MKYRVKKHLFAEKMVHFKCGKCSTRLKAKLKEAGIEDKCPECQQTFITPGKLDLEQLQAKESRETEEHKRKEELKSLKERIAKEVEVNRRVDPVTWDELGERFRTISTSIRNSIDLKLALIVCVFLCSCSVVIQLVMCAKMFDALLYIRHISSSISNEVPVSIESIDSHFVNELPVSIESVNETLPVEIKSVNGTLPVEIEYVYGTLPVEIR